MDWKGQSAWIAEHMDLPRATVDLVLSVEWECMIGVSILTGARRLRVGLPVLRPGGALLEEVVAAVSRGFRPSGRLTSCERRRWSSTGSGCSGPRPRRRSGSAPLRVSGGRKEMPRFQAAARQSVVVVADSLYVSAVAVIDG